MSRAAVSAAVLASFFPLESQALFNASVAWDSIEESALGFEENCPDPGGGAPTGEVRFCNRSEARWLSFPSRHAASLGLTVAEIEEWLWVEEAVQTRLPQMRAGKANLERMRDVMRDPSRLATDSVMRGELRRNERNIQTLADITHRMNELDRIMASSGSLSSAGLDYAADCTARGLGPVVTCYGHDKRMLNAAVFEIYRQTPLLAHGGIRNGLLDRLSRRGAAPLAPDDPAFLELLGNAAAEAAEDVDDRIESYEGILSEGTRLASALDAAEGATADGILDGLATGAGRVAARYRFHGHIQDTIRDGDLIQELVISTDPSVTPGLEPLAGAGCRLENRFLRGEAAAVIGRFAFDAALTIATFGAGGLAAGAANVGRASLIARWAPLLATEAIMTGSNLATYRSIEARCDRLRAQAFTAASPGLSDAGAELVRCMDQLQSHTIASLVGLAGTGAVVRPAYRLIRARLRAAGGNAALAATGARTTGGLTPGSPYPVAIREPTARVTTRRPLAELGADDFRALGGEIQYEVDRILLDYREGRIGLDEALSRMRSTEMIALLDRAGTTVGRPRGLSATAGTDVGPMMNRMAGDSSHRRIQVEGSSFTRGTINDPPEIIVLDPGQTVASSVASSAPLSDTAVATQALFGEERLRLMAEERYHVSQQMRELAGDMPAVSDLYRGSAGVPHHEADAYARIIEIMGPSRVPVAYGTRYAERSAVDFAWGRVPAG